MISSASLTVLHLFLSFCVPLSKFRPYVTLWSTQFINSPWLLWCPCSRPDRWPRAINARRCLSLWHSWGYPVYTGQPKSNVTTAAFSETPGSVPSTWTQPLSLMLLTCHCVRKDLVYLWFLDGGKTSKVYWGLCLLEPVEDSYHHLSHSNVHMTILLF